MIIHDSCSTFLLFALFLSGSNFSTVSANRNNVLPISEHSASAIAAHYQYNTHHGIYPVLLSAYKGYYLASLNYSSLSVRMHFIFSDIRPVTFLFNRHTADIKEVSSADTHISLHTASGSSRISYLVLYYSCDLKLLFV